MAGKVAFVLKGYPRLSETFICQEILALERRGLAIEIVSLRHPTDPATHPIHDEIRAPVHYLPEYLGDEKRRVWRAWRMVRRWPGYAVARATWLADLRRDRTRNRIRRFGQALVLASELPAGVTHLHAHFLHTPASVTRYASLLTGLPWTVSAHAKDIWTTADWEKREKLQSCAWAVTCTAINAAHLAERAPPGRVELVYHGFDPARFPVNDGSGLTRNGADKSDPVRLLSVGRAVAKKGYDVLLDALATLPADLHWTLVHVGGGPLLTQLTERARNLGLDHRIEWCGPLPQTDVLMRYRAADLFVLPSKISADGDRDGLPNVLMEAQSQSLACLATRVSAIPELIEDSVTGCLVAPDDNRALSNALAGLMTQPARRKALGKAGAAHVRENFDYVQGIVTLAGKFGL